MVRCFRINHFRQSSVTSVLSTLSLKRGRFSLRSFLCPHSNRLETHQSKKLHHAPSSVTIVTSPKDFRKTRFACNIEYLHETTLPVMRFINEMVFSVYQNGGHFVIMAETRLLCTFCIYN